MAMLNKDQVKDIITKALKEVADFSGDIENYEFKGFTEYQKKVFATKLVEFMNQVTYRNRNGTTDPNLYYDISLSVGKVSSWKTMTECIKFVLDNHTVEKRG